MKLVNNNSIINIENTNLFDNKFCFDILISNNKSGSVEIINLGELLKKRENLDMLEKAKQKPAIYSNAYSPKDELEIFTEIFEDAIKNKKRVHISGITLKEETDILEEYYQKLGFLRDEINCFDVDFKVPLVSVSVNIENLMRKGSDYKAQKDKIFFIPPIRESGQVKAMFKGINRGVIAGINLGELTEEKRDFLSKCITEEKILPITLAKVLKCNFEDIGIIGDKNEIIIEY